MKIRPIKNKLLTVLLTLCMMLSIVPMTAFATTIELPAGVSREYLYNHTYHTKVEITANVSVKDAGGSVIETAQMNKSGDFIEGNVSDPAVQAEIQGFDAEINAPFSSRGTLAVENRTKSLEFDHFDGNNLYSFIPASGDTVDFGTDTEAIEQYFAEHPDAVGTFNTIFNVREYQVHQITYDLIVQESGTTPAAVENVTLNYENISYKAGDIPHTTASVSEGNCAVAYEYWTEIRQPEGGGQWYETGRRWYSDSDKMASLPADERIINFEAGNSYQYYVVLAAGSGYSFSNDETVVSVGEDEWGTPRSHRKLEIKESGKELHIKMIYTFDLPNAGQPNVITSAAVENVKLDYKPGDAPRATATVAAADQGKYRIANEYWQELDENDVPVAAWYSDGGVYSTLPTITAFESGKKYVYSVMLLPEREYDFSRGVVATVNGNTVTAVPATDGYLSLPNVKTITPTAITQVNIESLYNYGVGDIPRKTAEPFDEEADKYEIAYECWEEMENGDPVAFWYSDESRYTPSMKRITQFEDGKSYMYSIELRAKAEYTFADNCVVRINVMPQSTVIKTQNGLFIPAIDTIHPATPKEIETVEINNATLSFKDGDKPVFTGSVPDGAKYVLAFEEWKTDGEWTRSDEWFNDADHHGNDKDITAFDKNKTYQYNLYIKLTAKAGEAGWVFGPNTVLKINGKEVSYTYQSSEENENNYRYSFGVVTDLTMTPQPSEVAHDYKIIEGANGVWTQNSNDILTFRANGEFQNFTGVKVDDKLITADEYNVTSNSMTITLKKDYLSTLSTGKHILTVLYNNGECSTEFEIKVASTVPSPTNPDNNSIGNTPNENKSNSGKIASPKTGDTSNMPLWLLFVNGSIAISTMVVSRKKKYNK